MAPTRMDYRFQRSQSQARITSLDLGEWRGWIRDRSSQATHAMRLLVPSIGGPLFRFFEAPAPRFGDAAMWTTAAALGASGVLLLIQGKGSIWTRVLLFGLLGITPGARTHARFGDSLTVPCSLFGILFPYLEQG